jgi:hypothetical protein
MRNKASRLRFASQSAGMSTMASRDHQNRSEKQARHERPDHGEQSAASLGHQGREHGRDRSGTDERHDGKSRTAGGADGAGGAPRSQGQAQANRDKPATHENRGHGGR